MFIPDSWRYKDVNGQIVLITGGGSGIGQLMAIKFIELGCKVVLWDINADGMAQTVKMIKDKKLDSSKCFSYKINLSDFKSIYEVAKRVKAEVGIVDILINNAGVVSGTNLLDTPDEKILLTFNVNTLSHFFTLKAFLPDMVKRNFGHVVTTASVAGNVGVSSLVDYCSSKFANVGMDFSLRMELNQSKLTGIKTTIVKPYFINTGMFNGANPGILPLLTPEYVVDEIMSGILAEKAEVTLPKFLNFLLPLIPVIPNKCLAAVYDFLGGYEFMAEFHGREPPKQKGKSQNEINNNTVNGSNVAATGTSKKEK